MKETTYLYDPFQMKCVLGKSAEIESRWVVPRGFREWIEMGSIDNGHGISFGSDENVLKLTELWEYPKSH